MGRLGSETAFTVLSVVNKLRAEGKDVISFGIGEPDFDTPAHIRNAAKKALDENRTHYGPSAGLPELRTAIAAYIARTRGIACAPEEVVVTPGAKPIIFTTVATCVNPGDEVIYPNPGFPIYESVIEWLGGVAVPAPLTERTNFAFDRAALAAAVTAKTKLLILNSPNNPTGGTLTRADLEFIADLARRHNFWVLSDEIYSQIIFGGKFESIAALPDMKERTIILDGFSKTYAMTGWRMGFGVMNRTLADLAARIEMNIESCTSTFSQIAGVQALTGPQDEARDYARQFHERVALGVKLLNEIPGVTCAMPGGAFYAFPNVTGACRNLGLKSSDELARDLLHRGGVAVLPRSCFGRRPAAETEEYVRLSFAASLDTIREGIGRMRTVIAG
jgi:aspartate/methionine/tyrosine aminotransferase